MDNNIEHKTLLFIVSYNAEKHIAGLLQRIQDMIPQLGGIDYEILLIDDSSKDNTVAVASEFKKNNPLKLTIFKNPVNQGYGGNQKIGYQYAIKFGFDSVVLLHGDAQYPPESIKAMLDKLYDTPADLVLGSRMLNKRAALKGKMPIYKFAGNIVLTRIQNLLLSTKLSEFHTGFKAYRVSKLKELPFAYNSNDFDFDTDIIIQYIVSGARIEEIAIPTHYGDEICNVNGYKYAFQVVLNSFLAKVQKYHIYYHPKFDFTPKETYESKVDFDSSHKFAIDNVAMHSTILDIGGSSGYVSEILRRDKKCTVYGVDQYESEMSHQNYDKFFRRDLDADDISGIMHDIPSVETILLLDVIEHLSNPELFLRSLRSVISADAPRVILTTGNIGFFMIRISLLLGNFSYGKRGILDFTHKRLFTFYSIKRLLNLQGYHIEKIEGIPIPFELIVGNKTIAKLMARTNRLLIGLSRSLFSFQIAMIVRPRPTLDVLLERANSIGPLGSVDS